MKPYLRIAAGPLQGWLFSAALLASMVQPAMARVACDMRGRSIDLPERLQRVYVASPPETYLLYAIDSSLLVGLNVPVQQDDREFLRPEFCALPVIGGYFGQGNTPSLEMLLKVRPQLVIGWDQNPAAQQFEDFLARFGIPVAYFNLENLTDYPRAMRIMGRLLGREERAEQLATYTERVLDEMVAKIAAIPVERRPRVYYAEGVDGLSTDGEPSWHSELIRLAGGRNVHHCRIESRYGMEKISIEQGSLVSLLGPNGCGKTTLLKLLLGFMPARCFSTAARYGISSGGNWPATSLTCRRCIGHPLPTGCATWCSWGACRTKGFCRPFRGQMRNWPRKALPS